MAERFSGGELLYWTSKEAAVLAVKLFRVVVSPFAAPLIAPLIAASAATTGGSSRRRGRGQVLQGRLVDVGDAWRALLLGAPPELP